MKQIIILFLFLTISAFISSIPVQPVGSGNEIDPYIIESLDNLEWLSTTSSSWGSYFIQTNDIDASDTQNWNSGEGFLL